MPQCRPHRHEQLASASQDNPCSFWSTNFFQGLCEEARDIVFLSIKHFFEDALLFFSFLRKSDRGKSRVIMNGLKVFCFHCEGENCRFVLAKDGDISD